MDYESYCNHYSDKLKEFAYKYYKDNFNRDKLKLTEERFNNLLDLIGNTKSESLEHKLTYLYNYLCDIADSEELPEVIENNDADDQILDRLEVVGVKMDILKIDVAEYVNSMKVAS